MMQVIGKTVQTYGLLYPLPLRWCSLLSPVLSCFSRLIIAVITTENA
ncbi:hypothetical protein [Colwellia sp. C1TZA3]|nr:hypothetical protein [Colwellia sp. C1TZA3]